MPHSPDRLRRSLLFVPGNRPDRFPKAAASGADMICLDLEDAVLAESKLEARTQVIAYLTSHRPICETAVRINSPRSRTGLEDLLALADASTRPDLVVVPKVESAEELTLVADVLGEAAPGPQLVALVESLRGLGRVAEIAAQSAVKLLGLGTADLAAEMAVTMAWEPMLLARLQLVQAAKRAGKAAMDGAWLQIDELAGLELEAVRAAQLGFTAKPCLHPRQIEAVHAALSPTDGDAERAREIISAFEAASAGVVLVNGRMIDRPMVDAARRLLTQWKASQPYRRV